MYNDKEQLGNNNTGRVTRESLGHLKGIDGAFDNKSVNFKSTLNQGEKEIYITLQTELESTELMRLIGSTKDVRTLSIIKHLLNEAVIEQLKVIRANIASHINDWERDREEQLRRGEQLHQEMKNLEETLESWT